MDPTDGTVADTAGDQPEPDLPDDTERTTDDRPRRGRCGRRPQP